MSGCLGLNPDCNDFFECLAVEIKTDGVYINSPVYVVEASSKRNQILLGNLNIPHIPFEDFTRGINVDIKVLEKIDQGTAGIERANFIYTHVYYGGGIFLQKFLDYVAKKFSLNLASCEYDNNTVPAYFSEYDPVWTSRIQTGKFVWNEITKSPMDWGSYLESLQPSALPYALYLYAVSKLNSAGISFCILNVPLQSAGSMANMLGAKKLLDKFLEVLKIKGISNYNPLEKYCVGAWGDLYPRQGLIDIHPVITYNYLLGSARAFHKYLTLKFSGRYGRFPKITGWEYSIWGVNKTDRVDLRRIEFAFNQIHFTLPLDKVIGPIMSFLNNRLTCVPAGGIEPTLLEIMGALNGKLDDYATKGMGTFWWDKIKCSLSGTGVTN